MEHERFNILHTKIKASLVTHVISCNYEDTACQGNSNKMGELRREPKTSVDIHICRQRKKSSRLHKAPAVENVFARETEIKAACRQIPAPFSPMTYALLRCVLLSTKI